jgi:hypothetical protein
MIDLNRSVKEIVEKGFLELDSVTIHTRYYKSSDSFFSLHRFNQYGYRITADTSLKNAGLSIMTGGLAHEIAHISRDIQMTNFVYVCDRLSCKFFQKYDTKIERATDLLVVERGFGEQLLAFIKYAERWREKYTEKDGLTRKELEELLKH